MADLYGIGGYGQMIADRARTEAYAAALKRFVRPGSVVLDIGTGTGIFALLACRFGARRVFAVEPADAVQTAREIAAAQGLDDRIDFIQGVSTRVELPERADVIVSDLRGALPLFHHAVPSLIDARERLLAPGGVMIPRADRLLAAVVSAPEIYDRVVSPWDEGSFDFDMGAARRRVVNTWTRGEVADEQRLTDAGEWTTLDYASIDGPDARGRLEWEAARGGTAHGVSVWFDADLGDGIGYSTGPGTKTVYGTPFFPWETPVEVKAGDRIEVEIVARLVGDDYVWFWSSRVRRDGATLADFRQSTFHAEPPSADRLRRRADAFRPSLNEDGRIDHLALSRMAEGVALGDIAREVRERFPVRFRTWEQALTHVGRLSERYSE